MREVICCIRIAEYFFVDERLDEGNVLDNFQAIRDAEVEALA